MVDCVTIIPRSCRLVEELGVRDKAWCNFIPQLVFASVSSSVLGNPGQIIQNGTAVNTGDRCRAEWIGKLSLFIMSVASGMLAAVMIYESAANLCGRMNAYFSFAHGHRKTRES